MECCGPRITFLPFKNCFQISQSAQVTRRRAATLNCSSFVIFCDFSYFHDTFFSSVSIMGLVKTWVGMQESIALDVSKKLLSGFYLQVWVSSVNGFLCNIRASLTKRSTFQTLGISLLLIKFLHWLRCMMCLSMPFTTLGIYTKTILGIYMQV